MRKPTGPTNIQKRALARMLWKTQKPIWRVVSEHLMAPEKNRVEKNLSVISKVTKDGDVIIVPGKVLADGELTTKITVACYAVSVSARKKITASGSKILTIEELVEKIPTGKGVRIIC
jgi:large subunit ribosomal protein L18e